MQPLVSVIIPAYNAARFLPAALESAVGQTYRSLEIIVVDDGSEDDTSRIVEAAAARDARVRLIRQPNAGVAAARNAGIAVARGTYVAPLDADDVWFATKVAQQVSQMEAAGHDVALAYTWWVGIDPQGVRRFSSHPWRVAGDAAEALVAINFIGNASVPMFRRTCLEAVGGYETAFRRMGAPGAEDWDLSLRLAERFLVAVVPEYLVGYRRVGGSMATDYEAMARSHELMLARLCERRPEIAPRLLRWSRGQMHTYIAMVAARTGAYGTALRWLVKGLMASDVSYRSPWMVEDVRTRLLPVGRHRTEHCR